MTDGTSQGLFIVVAIVIFGIFVVMAYILFEDTLSPAMANMFTAATEQSDSRLNPWVTVIEKSDVELSSTRISDSEAVGTRSLLTESEYFEQGGRYKISFDVTLNSGEVLYIGGHNHITDKAIVRINNKVSKNPTNNVNDWNNGVPIDIEVGETKHVTVDFTANRYEETLDGHTDKRVNLTLGRIKTIPGYNFRYPLNFAATISNFKIETIRD